MRTEALPNAFVEFYHAFQVQCRVIGAVMLRDMRTRFGHTHLSFLAAVAWPLSHLTFMLIGYLSLKRVVPIGSNPTVFFATGALPYILCLYPARMMIFSVEHNRGILIFSICKTIDIIIARAVVEFLSAFLVVIIFCSFLFVVGIDFMPSSPSDAILATIACVYLGVCIGIVNTITFMLFRFWGAIFVPVMILFYITAGVIVPPEGFSQDILNLMWYNPLFHCVDWFRTAFYENYGDTQLARWYVFAIGTVYLFLGLLGERLLRGRMLIE